MNYSAIKYCDIANGIGVRTTLFVSGCQRHCPFCFNQEAADFEAGKPFDEATQEQILDSMEPPYVDGFSILGGEPMERRNQAAVADFLERVRERFPHKNIWLYSGFTWEELRGKRPAAAPYKESPVTEDTKRILGLLDVLVDGPFVQEKKDISLRFRGSENQRLIDVPESLKQDRAVLWHDDPLYETHTM